MAGRGARRSLDGLRTSKVTVVASDDVRVTQRLNGNNKSRVQHLERREATYDADGKLLTPPVPFMPRRFEYDDDVASTLVRKRLAKRKMTLASVEKQMHGKVSNMANAALQQQAHAFSAYADPDMNVSVAMPNDPTLLIEMADTIIEMAMAAAVDDYGPRFLSHTYSAKGGYAKAIEALRSAAAERGCMLVITNEGGKMPDVQVAHPKDSDACQTSSDLCESLEPLRFSLRPIDGSNAPKPRNRRRVQPSLEEVTDGEPARLVPVVTPRIDVVWSYEWLEEAAFSGAFAPQYDVAAFEAKFGVCVDVLSAMNGRE